MTYKIEIYVTRSGWIKFSKCSRVLSAEKDKLEFINEQGNKILVSGLPYLISEEHDN